MEKNLREEINWLKEHMMDVENNQIPFIKSCFAQLQHKINEFLSKYGYKIEIADPKKFVEQKTLDFVIIEKKVEVLK